VVLLRNFAFLVKSDDVVEFEMSILFLGSKKSKKAKPTKTPTNTLFFQQKKKCTMLFKLLSKMILPNLEKASCRVV
jgi:hypothetical protein